MRERTRLEYEPPQEKPSSMKEIVEFLKSKAFDPEQHFYEFEVSGEIEPNQIRALLQLPYEIALTEHNGKVILSTGVTRGMGLEHQYYKRRHHSKLSFHTHTENDNKRSPSFADVYNSDFSDSSTPLLLAYKEGIMVYRKPFIDPDTGQETHQEARNVALVYGKKKGVDIFGFELDPSLKQWQDMSHDEKGAFQRQFAEETGMIIAEALWDDEEGVKKIMEYVNLKK